MSAEKIISQIKKDSEREIRKIQKETEKQIAEILNAAKLEGEKEAKKILEAGKIQSENIKRIMISKAYQDVKRDLMNAREKVIDECFVKAIHKLSKLKEGEYKRMRYCIGPYGRDNRRNDSYNRRFYLRDNNYLVSLLEPKIEVLDFLASNNDPFVLIIEPGLIQQTTHSLAS